MSGAGAPDPGPGGTVAAVRRLLDDALDRYTDHPDAAVRLRDQRRRLDEPLRVALVGRVKAGKSTLLNALVGERLAPTDAGECTRIVTLYRHGAVPRVALTRMDGTARALPARRVDGALQLDLGGTAPAEVAQLVVDWPAPALAEVSLVDTPGLGSLSADASARTQAFLEEGERLRGADAVVFLTRRMQSDDLEFLSSFQAGSGAGCGHPTTLTVLSRADEVGTGRLDSLRSARHIAERVAADPAVRQLCSAVVPVSGLLAVAGRMMRHRDFVGLSGIAAADPADAELLLLSADRFCRQDTPVPVSQVVRAGLLDRFGLFGIRLSVALIRAGVSDATALAAELQEQSGFGELQRLIAVQFTRRAAQLKAAAALRTVERVLRVWPAAGNEPLLGEVERLRLAAHDLVELELLARSRAADAPLPEVLRPEAERLLGAEGTGAAERLGLPPGTPRAELRSVALDTVARWRAAATDPLAERRTVDAIAVVVRSCEGVLAALDAEPTALESPP